MTANLPHELPLIQSGELDAPDKKLLDRAKTAMLSAVVTAEVLPITNEGSRFGALAATEVMTRNPVIGAAVLGGSTLLVEGAGALAASEILTSNTSSRILNWVNSKIEKWVPEDAKMSKPVEAGVAMTLGTSITMAAAQRQNPERSKEEARKHGLITAAWMAGVFAVEGAMISEGIDNYANPTAVGAALITAGALLAVPKWVKNSIKRGEGMSTVAEAPEQGQTPISTAAYEAYRDQHDEAVKIGLYDTDLTVALEDPRTILLAGTSSETAMPLLVPIDQLEWYNKEYLQHVVDADSPIYYFAHPPLETPEAQQCAATIIRDQLESGAIIVTDEYATEQTDAQDTFTQILGPHEYIVENLGESGEQNLPKIAHVFAGLGDFGFAEDHEQLLTKDVYEVYEDMVEHGEVADGISLEASITGDEARKIWEIYERPFERLSDGHPVLAGFDQESLIDLLANPNMLKAVNRIDGEITTVCLVTQDFDLCPWFNKHYYDEKYSDYYRNDNILIFPSIVSDDEKSGNNYAAPLINFVTQLFKNRGQDVLVTFECTEISAQYVPAIVEYAVNVNDVATIAGLNEPISTTRYKVIRKPA